MEVEDRVPLGARVARSVAPLVAIVMMATIALVAMNHARETAVLDAGTARAEAQDLRRSSQCRDELAAAVDLANTEALGGLARYIRALSTPGGNPSSVEWDSILAKMDEVQARRANTEATCRTK